MSPISVPPASSDPQVVVRTLLRSHRASDHNRRIARDLVWHWVAKRWPRLMPDRSQQEDASIHHVLPGRSLRVVCSEDGAAWALEVATTERDGSRWSTTAVVADAGPADLLALETRCADTPVTRVVAPPKVLASWVQRLSLEDAGIRVESEARLVESAEDAELLCRQLLLPERRLPIVALANKAGTRYYGADPRGVAETLRGLAHVVCVEPPAVLALTHQFGRRLAPVPGAVRVYLPGFDPADEAAQHPVIRPRKPEAGEEPAANEGTAFRRYLCQRVCELGATAAPAVGAVELGELMAKKLQG